MTAKWNVDYAAGIIKQHITNDVDTIITFDAYGVSGHPNHQACHQAVRKLAGKVECYQLHSTWIVLKYLGWTTFWADRMLCRDDGRLLFVLSPFQVMTSVYEAMKQHKSQLVWFRWLYVVFSKYMIINQLQRMQ